MTRVWIGDNCHTFDRKNFEAQNDCGVGKNYRILEEATKSNFTLSYFPYIQSDKNKQCMENFVWDSNKHVLQSKGNHLRVAAATLSIITSIIYSYI